MFQFLIDSGLVYALIVLIPVSLYALALIAVKCTGE